jgi:hypothetical protein
MAYAVDKASLNTMTISKYQGKAPGSNLSQKITLHDAVKICYYSATRIFSLPVLCVQYYIRKKECIRFLSSPYITEGKSKRGFPKKKKNMYFKYTETKLISLFIVIPLDFNAPVPVFHKFFLIASGRKSIWLRL